MTAKEVELLVEFVLNLSDSLNKKINYHSIDLNEQKFAQDATKLLPIFKNITQYLEEESIDQKTWDYGCEYLEKSYNLKLNTPDIVLDEILITAKTLLGLCAANFRKQENET